MKITAKGKNARHTPIRGVHEPAGGGAMVFDTYRPTGNRDLGWDKCSGDDGDKDLGAPNGACPGSGHKPGHGNGGKPYLSNGDVNPYANCEPLGNVLIIQESNKDCPDDTAGGGWLIFEFPQPTEVNFAKLLDVDEGNNRPRFKIHYGDGSTPKLTDRVPGTGDNGVIQFALNENNVVKVELEFWGSGSIAELNYRFCPPDDECPLTTWDFEDLTAGQYIHDELWNTRGVKVTAKKSGNKGFTPLPPNYNSHTSAGGGAMVFDTYRPTGNTDLGWNECSGNDGDNDLGAPKSGCPNISGHKPGVGAGGAMYIDGELNRYRNCDPLGNVLVIQESNKSCPDDNVSGGWIIFDFKHASTVQMAALLDVDEGNTPDIDITYGDGTTAPTIHTEATGENGLLFQPILLDNVKQFKIRYYGSGSISEITYSNCPSYV